MNNQALLLKLPTLALGCALPLCAPAQTPATSAVQLEEIIVTAERRSIDLQNAALSIVAIDGDTLQLRGDSDVTQVLRNVPGITIEGGTAGASINGGGGPPRVSIRGIGTDGPNKSSATAFYEDGVFLTGGGAYFHDVERVELLRGPQGTLYGRGATAGAVNLITKKPTQQSAAAASIEFGSYNLQHITGMANQPLSDSLAIRISFNSSKRDAIFNNGYNELDDTNTRIKLLYQPSDNFSLLLGGVYYRANGTGSAAVPLLTPASKPTDWITAYGPGPSNDVTYKRVFGELNWNIGFGTLTYIPSFATNKSNNIAFGSGMSAAGRVTTVSPKDHTQTHELRIASNSDSALSWIGGAYYYKNVYNFSLLNELPNTDGTFSPGGGPTRSQFFDLQSKAIFGEVTYAATDSLRFVGGIRESYDDVHHIDHQVARTPNEDIINSKDFSSFDWKARVEKDLSTDNLLYASASTGYRPGGSVNGTSYDPEEVTSYELGSKNQFGNQMILNVSAFYSDYGGFQAPQNFTCPTTACNFITQIISASATFFGVEADLTVQLTNNDKLSIAPSYIKSEFTEDYISTNPFTGVQSTVLSKGKSVPHSPEFTASIDYQHRFNLANGAAITAQADARYSSEYRTIFDATAYATVPDQRVFQDAYTIANASLLFTSASQRYFVTAYGKNLTNKIYTVSVGGGLPGASSANVNDPRTYGLMFSARFE